MGAPPPSHSYPLARQACERREPVWPLSTHPASRESLCLADDSSVVVVVNGTAWPFGQRRRWQRRFPVVGSTLNVERQRRQQQSGAKNLRGMHTSGVVVVVGCHH